MTSCGSIKTKANVSLNLSPCDEYRYLLTLPILSPFDGDRQWQRGKSPNAPASSWGNMGEKSNLTLHQNGDSDAVIQALREKRKTAPMGVVIDDPSKSAQRGNVVDSIMSAAASNQSSCVSLSTVWVSFLPLTERQSQR